MAMGKFIRAMLAIVLGGVVATMLARDALVDPLAFWQQLNVIAMAAVGYAGVGIPLGLLVVALYIVVKLLGKSKDKE